MRISAGSQKENRRNGIFSRLFDRRRLSVSPETVYASKISYSDKCEKSDGVRRAKLSAAKVGPKARGKHPWTRRNTALMQG